MPTDPKVQTPAFRRWFGNSAVVDKRGRPKVVYHGTRAPEFTVFQPFYRKGEQLGFGIHFAEDYDFAKRYAEEEGVTRKGKGTPRIYPVYLSIQRPLFANAIVTEGTPEFELARKLAGRRQFLTETNELGQKIAIPRIDGTDSKRAERLIREAGYDGVAYSALLMERTGYGFQKIAESPSWVVFDPAQIKSATDNRGTFDPADPDILHGLPRHPRHRIPLGALLRR
jgi:hypothetical protein